MMQPNLPEIDNHGDERTTLIAFLEYQRAVLVRKMDGLDADQLAASIPPSPLSLGGLWFHMALVEDIWFEERIAGRPLPEPWAGAPFGDDPDWEINTAHTRTAEELATAFSAAVDRSRATIEACASLDQATVVPARDSTTRSLRWVLVHMIEEYARHCGHADLLREVIDGRVGD